MHAKASSVSAEKAAGFNYPNYMQYVTDSSRILTHGLNFSNFMYKGL